MTQSIATEWLDDVLTELREIGLNDLVHFAGEAHRDAYSLAVIAAYVTERDDAMDRGLSREWLVEGPSAPRRGVTCHTVEKAQSYQRRFGAGHTIRIGYGNSHTWRVIDVAALVRMAQRVAA